MRTVFFACASLSVIAGHAFAEEAIVIEATRLPAGLAGASVTVIDDANIEKRQDVFVLDALERAPGLTIAQNGAFGGQASVRLRGASADQTLVLIDGVAVNDVAAPGAGFNFATLDTANIQRIQVLRGAQSTLWGSDAIGGVISIETKRAASPFRAQFGAEAGAFETRRTTASLSARRGAVDGSFDYGAIVSDGISKADEADGNTEDDPLASLSTTARVGLDLGEGARLEAFGAYANSDSAFDSFGFVTGVADGDEDTDVTERRAGLVARFKTGAVSNIAQVSTAGIERRNFSDGAFSFGAQGRRDAVRYQGDVRLGRVGLAFGGEHERLRADTGAGQARTDITGVFALTEWAISDAFSVSLGARQDDHSAFGDVTTLRAGLQYNPGGGPLTVRASFGEGFKAPTVFQLTSAFGVLPPNAALQPEEAEGYDVGIAWRSEKLQVELTAFALDVTNQIDFDFGALRYENIAAVETKGVELSGAWDLTSRLGLSGAVTYTDAKNAQTGAPLIRIPEYAATLSADWQALESLGLSVSARYNGEETDVIRSANPLGRVPAWTRVDANARYAVSDAVEVYGRVENLADDKYQDVFGYGTLGRAATIGVRVRLQ
jgi:vitamin B12 transporter